MFNIPPKPKIQKNNSRRQIESAKQKNLSEHFWVVMCDEREYHLQKQDQHRAQVIFIHPFQLTKQRSYSNELPPTDISTSCNENNSTPIHMYGNYTITEEKWICLRCKVVYWISRDSRDIHTFFRNRQVEQATRNNIFAIVDYTQYCGRTLWELRRYVLCQS